MNRERHESGERDWRDGPGNGSGTLDQLSREEILLALAGLDERLKTNAENALLSVGRGDDSLQAGRRLPSGGGLQQGHTVGAGQRGGPSKPGCGPRRLGEHRVAYGDCRQYHSWTDCLLVGRFSFENCQQGLSGLLCVTSL